MRQCAFSGDNKFLATIGGIGADTVLVVWKWNSEVAMAVAKCNPVVTRVKFVPRDSSLITISGPAYLRLWRCQGDTLKEMHMLPPKHELEVTCCVAGLVERPLCVFGEHCICVSPWSRKVSLLIHTAECVFVLLPGVSCLCLLPCVGGR